MSPSTPEDRSKWSPARVAHQRRVSEAHERAAEQARRHAAHDSVAHEALVSLRGAEGEVRKAMQALAVAEARLGPARADFERVFGGNTCPCSRCEGGRREFMRERRLSHIEWRNARPDEGVVVAVVESLVTRRELDRRQGEGIARGLGYTLDDAAA